MSTLRTATGLLLGAALLLGCIEEGGPTASSHESLRPRFNFNNNPDGGSAHIFRFENQVLFVIFDAPLAAVHASDALFADGCGAGAFLEPVDVQGVVEDPNDPVSSQIRELTLAKEIYIAIVDLTQPGDCFGFTKVADGIGQLVNTDNDLFIFNRDHRNTNAFGFTAQGRLNLVAGGTAHYNGVLKCHWDGFDEASLQCKESINFQ